MPWGQDEGDQLTHFVDIGIHLGIHPLKLLVILFHAEDQELQKESCFHSMTLLSSDP